MVAVAVGRVMSVAGAVSVTRVAWVVAGVAVPRAVAGAAWVVTRVSVPGSIAVTVPMRGTMSMAAMAVVPVSVGTIAITPTSSVFEMNVLTDVSMLVFSVVLIVMARLMVVAMTVT